MAKLKMEATAQSPYTATNLLCVTGKKEQKIQSSTCYTGR